MDLSSPSHPLDLFRSECVLSTVGDVKESIFVFVVFVDGANGGTRGWKDSVHEQEHGFLRGKLNSLADNVHKLSHSQVGWNEELSFVDVLDG